MGTNIFPDSKRSQSQVITTILLILISISMIVIVMGIVIPFVKDRLSESECIKYIDRIEIENNKKYTCYSSLNNGEMSVQIHIGNNESLDGFFIEMGGASSKSYEIKNGIINNDIKMFNGNYNEILEIPGRNEERTYVFKSVSLPESISVYPLIDDGKLCSSSSELNKIVNC